MREIIQVDEFYVRGRKAVEKIKSVIQSGEASEILMEGQKGEVFKIPTNLNFLKPTLDMVKGMMKEIKECKLIVVQRQMSLFG
jgi:hypothetical protein